MNRKTLVLSLSLLVGTNAFAALKSDPGIFDFGWAPDNSRIFCEFSVKNMGTDSVNLQALKPACGCTAAQFTPMSLASDADTRIGLAFNTRGYRGHSFSKTAELTTENNSSNITVYFKGVVMDSEAKLLPVGSGIASFEPTTKGNSQKIVLQNKSDKDLKLAIIQSPASWAKLKFGADTVKAGQTADITVVMNGSFDQVRETSLTLEGSSGDARHRVTLAIRTGPPAKDYQPLRPAASGIDVGPKQQNGLNDPLHLKPVEPVKKSK
jgi:hypothetical protein